VLRDKENLGIFFVGIIPSILNYLLLVKIFSLDALIGYADYVSLYGTFFIIVSIFTQFMPTYFYSKLSKNNGLILVDYFKVLNIFLSLIAFTLYDAPFEINVLIIVFGLTLYNHSLICLTDYFIGYNLQKKFLTGSMMGLVVFSAKIITYLMISYWIRSFYYFYFIEGLIISLFVGPRRVFRKLSMKVPSKDLLDSILVLLGRLLYFIILPWSLYLGAGDRIDLKTSIFLNERLFFSGVGLIITPFIPKIMLGSAIGGFKIRWLHAVIILCVYCFAAWLAIKRIDTFIVEKYLNGDLRILLGFVFLMPLHTLISFYSRVSLTYNKEQWKIYWVLSLVLIGLGYLQRLITFDIIMWFLMIMLIQLILSKSILKLIPNQTKI